VSLNFDSCYVHTKKNPVPNFNQELSTSKMVIRAFLSDKFLMNSYLLNTVKNAVELLGAFRPDVEKIQYH
jgi:hypothetical protein